MSANHIEQFRRAMERAGIQPPDSIIDDGNLHRFGTNGKGSDDAGWYVLHGDGVPAGKFGCWRSGVSETFRADIGRELTADEQRAQRERMAAIERQREADRKRRQAAAADRGREIWDAAKPAPADHPYLTSHRVQPRGLRVYRGGLAIRDMPCDGALIVPLSNSAGTIQTLEFISSSGDKRYLPGGMTTGGYHAIGAGAEAIVVCEGWATGAAIHEATTLPVRCAMSAANLRAVAEAARAQVPGARLIIAGDNDEGGTGQRAAEDAARAIGGLVAIPEGVGADWCDVRIAQGDEAVRTGIAKAREPDATRGTILEPPPWLDDRPPPEEPPGERVPAVPLGEVACARKLTGIDFSAMRAHLSDAYSVKGLILPNSLVGIIGQSGSGKTFFATDLALYIASGRMWRAHRVRGGLVVYAALEGPVSAENRFVAARDHGRFPPSIPLRLTPGPINLRDEDDVALLIEFIREAEAHFGEKCIAVFVDTLSRAMAGGDENGPEDMGALIRGADAVRLATGAAVILVHHLGKDETKGARGHSSLKAALDTEIEVSGKGELHVATVTKQRDLPSGTQFTLRLKVVELGQDADGEPVTTCVVEATDEQALPASAIRELRGKAQRQLLTALRARAAEKPGRVWSLVELRAVGRELGMPKGTARSVVDVLVTSSYMRPTVGGYLFTDGKG